VAWHARESLTGGRRNGSKLAQVSHGGGRGAGWVECRGEQLVRSGLVMVYERGCEREWCSNYSSQKLELLRNLKHRDIGTKSVNRYTDRETVSRVATFGNTRRRAARPWKAGQVGGLVASCGQASPRRHSSVSRNFQRFGEYALCCRLQHVLLGTRPARGVVFSALSASRQQGPRQPPSAWCSSVPDDLSIARAHQQPDDRTTICVVSALYCTLGGQKL